jgi:hypothetical protein
MKESTIAKAGPGAFSADGYAICQDAFSQFRYRNMDASINDCGFIAVYDLLHFVGSDVDIDEVRRELESMMHRFPGPTTMRAMRNCLKRHLPNFREHHGRRACLLAAKASLAGIFRYHEERIPHFVTYIRQENGFRFFNVNDGLEDFVCAMDEFAAKHIVFGPVSLFCITGNKGLWNSETQNFQTDRR